MLTKRWTVIGGFALTIALLVSFMSASWRNVGLMEEWKSCRPNADFSDFSWGGAPVANWAVKAAKK